MGYLTENSINWWNEELKPKFLDFWRENRFRVNWTDISKMKNMTADVIREFQNELDWNMLNRNTSIDEKTLEEFWDRIDWKDILTRREFSEDFIRKHKYDLDWKQISYFQGQLSEDFVEEMKDYIVWDQFNPYRNTWEKYSTQFKVRHWNDMKRYYKESGHFWGEELKLVCDCGEIRILRTKYDTKFGTMREYL